MNIQNKKIGSVLVIGGGIGGMQASLDLADAGFKVYLVENSPAIGGKMSQLDKTFPTNDCSMCIMAPRLVDVDANLNIDLLTNSELTKIEGEIGNFNVHLLKYPRYVDEEKCTGCGECTTKCPVKKPNEYNLGLNQRRNIYIPYAQAVPLVAKIDKETCTYFIKGKCKLCQKICKAGAIDYEQKPKEITLQVGSIILALGFEPINPNLREEYGYGYYKNVITSLEFERYLSASGPTSGHVKRPSDDREPKKIAWIQCVGSRDEDRKYCSSVCCMYATKQAIIAKEHNRELEPTIFFMDVRAFGKGFDNYYERAKDEYRIRYLRCMVSTVKENPKTKNLIIRYVADNELVEEEFDLVILSVGLKPATKAQKLAQTLGIELNQYNFCATSTFTPTATSKEGIYVCGAFSEPKDIPETVMQASGAASCVGEILGEVRGTMITKKEYPQEIDVNNIPPRIGVFVCRCGINIAAVVDVPAVTEYAKTLPNVVCVEEKIYLCSQDSQSLIKEKIKEYNLNRVVVASCTPRTHERLFQDTIREAGLNKYLFEMANIRDQCSWVHGKEHESATQKAKKLVKMSVARASLLEPLHHSTIGITRKTLIIGGGLAGMVSALSLAKQGFEVELVEKESELGGNLRHVYFTLEGANPQEYLKSLIERVTNHKLIKVHLKSEIVTISGHVGHFKSEIRNPKSEIRNIEHSVAIVATGGVESKPTEYLYGQDDRVITQLQLEAQLADYRVPITNYKTVVMIQCVGSRDNERPYCSRICCSQAIKNALKLKEKNKDVQIYILYRDIRTYGFREEYYCKAREAGIIFIRYDVDAKPVVTNNGPLKVKVNDPILAEEIILSPDIVVLAPAIVPYPESEKLASLMKVTLNAERFFLEAHLKLRPVDFATEGMFLCGLAHSPKDISESIVQAQAAAARAATILSKDHLEVGGVVSTIDKDKCVACLTCIRMCPYDVPFINTKGVAEIDPAKCQGCGICAAECPAKAIQLMHYKDNQMLAKTTALFT